MPIVTDLLTVRALLERDRPWAAYAIGDLAPGFIEHCEWRAPSSGTPALLLLYGGFEPPILFAMGQRRDVRGLVEEIDVPKVSLHLQPDAVEAMGGLYATHDLRPMLRMVLPPNAFRPAAHDDVRLLGKGDLAAIVALYEDGERRGEGPSFFYPSMLEQGTFRGVWEDGALVSVAGTHLYAAELGVCAIGNIYTRSDRRGRGLAARATSAVVTHALAQHVDTIVLNVSVANRVARRVYVRLGFAEYCRFFEGEATRAAATDP